ncbi:7-deoxyloganetic acid glucosyltransferase-like [Pistacia vera]|uniref:7-deoxyloganetic acid glucosyltransferase-like n=1 Tax=Pistacia vera TaxID=55513 RepID=UPI001263A313|nr:7-deoxyloganetic acid glucosyltransferase-like [Pistacia vera]
MEENPHSPHLLIFPLPFQGHLNSMLKLAELLSLQGLSITFLNSHHSHKRLLRYTDIHARFAQYPGFRFKTFSDGLPDDHPRTIHQITEMFDALYLSARPFLKKMLIDTLPPVSCIIGDGILGFVPDVAKELKIPLIHFRTVSACSIWAYFCIPLLIQAGNIPLRGRHEDMDRLITTVPGMEAFLRGRDLPGICKDNDINDRIFQFVLDATLKSSEVDVLLLNTFEDLEGPMLSHIRTKCPKIYTIGPLHLHLETRLAASNNMESFKSSNSLWEVDRSCMVWLDKQPPQSVIYVSFGSLAMLTREQYLEFWHGLVNSKQRFLWVTRPGSVGGDDDSAMELAEGTKERGYIVGWAPQEEVLAHKAVGGFLTHSGWNSTLESIVAGVPMICWPCLADQPLNSRFVSEVWKIGIDMKDVCDRKVVERMINDVMVERREEFVKSAKNLATLARRSISDGGSSRGNLDLLINDIRNMSFQTHCS